MTAYEAQNDCLLRGANLMRVDSQELMDVIDTKVRENGYIIPDIVLGGIWTGLTIANWQWEDGM